MATAPTYTYDDVSALRPCAESFRAATAPEDWPLPALAKTED